MSIRLGGDLENRLEDAAPTTSNFNTSVFVWYLANNQGHDEHQHPSNL